MASLRELIIKISANSSSYQTEIARASRMGGEYYKTMEQGSRKAEAASRQSQRALADLNGQLTSVKTAAASMAGVFVSLFAVGNIINAADQWGQYQSRIKMATGSVEEFRSVQARLLEISDRTYKNIDEQAELYIRSSTAMKELGYNTKGTIDFIDSISSSLTINAASAEKGKSAIDALSKSMVTGKVSGQEWNTVMEVMPTVIGDIARYLGTTETAVKSMAANGKLSMDTFAKATIAARQRNAELAEAMPTTVGDAITKLNNHFKTYITDVNASSGATQALSGTIGYLADHIDDVVTAAGILGGIGLARTIGSWATSTALSAKRFAEQTANQLALAAAQREGLTVTLSQIGAERAGAVAAQQSLVAQLKLAQTEQTRTAIRKQLAVNSAEVTRLTRAETAATAELNAVQQRLAASTGLMKGALGLIGGIPGLLMLGAGAWYYMYQQQEQARASAEDYAKTLDQVLAKLPKMTLPTISENQDSAKKSFEVQNQKISEQLVLIDDLERRIASLNKTREQPDWKKGYSMYSPSDAENIKAIEDATAKLAVERARLTQMQDEAKNIGASLEEIERRRIDLLREQAAKENAAYQSLLMMNGQHTEFNRLLGMGNALLADRNGLMSGGPLRIPQASVTDAEQQALLQKQQAAELAGLEGIARVRKQAQIDLQRMGKTGPENATFADQYTQAMEKEHNETQRLAQAKKDKQKAEQDANSETKKSASIAKEYEQKLSTLNKEIMVEAVRLKDGDAAAALFAASMEAGTKWTDAQRAGLEQLNKTLAEAKQRWEDHNAAIANDPYRAAAEIQKKANEQLQRQIADGEIKNAEDIARRKQDIDTAYLQAKAEAAQRYAVSGTAELAGNIDPIQNLENQLAKRHALIESYAAAGVVSQDRANQLIVASDRDAMEQRYQASLQLYASQGDMQKAAVDVFQTVQERGVNMLTGLLTKTQDWKEGMSNLFASFAQSAIKNLMDVAAQALWTSNVMQTITGVAGGLMGGISGAASGASGATGFDTGAFSNLSFNALGGVYSSPSLSAYSGQIVSSPTMFAFAKGAGIMGEAGPEAIMPLTRAADGSLGVRAVGQVDHSVQSTPQGQEQLAAMATTANGIMQTLSTVANWLSASIPESRVSAGSTVWDVATASTAPTSTFDRSLDIRPTTASQSAAAREAVSSSAPVVSITINNDGQNTVSAPPGLEQFGSEVQAFVDQRFKALLQKETGQGRLLSTAMRGPR